MRRKKMDTSALLSNLQEQVVGQHSIEQIVPYVEMYEAGLAPEGRPVGIFMLLGPTGTGKTHTVESLAKAIHGNSKAVLRVDCGEFQMEHEVCKLIGAPPGYLGHRETTPMLTQAKLNSVTSEASSLSIVLFDEIEKAADSLYRMLLGVLDRAMLKLGDNSTVNFERSLIFLTSNLGARRMSEEIGGSFGFAAPKEQQQDLEQKLEQVALRAVKKKFTPEFVNRIDVVATYLPLDASACERILDQQLADFQRHVRVRLGERAFYIEATREAREFLLREGFSEEFGARELRRALHRHVIQPIASMVVAGDVGARDTVVVDCRDGNLIIHTRELAMEVGGF